EPGARDRNGALGNSILTVDPDQSRGGETDVRKTEPDLPGVLDLDTSGPCHVAFRSRLQATSREHLPVDRRTVDVPSERECQGCGEVAKDSVAIGRDAGVLVVRSKAC